MRLTHGLVQHKLAMLAVKAAELNLDTSKLLELEITQVLTAMVYINVFVPTELTSRLGETTPVLAFNQLAPLALNVPPVAETVIVFGVEFVQKGAGGVITGTARFTDVTEIVLVIGQLTMAGFTVTE